MRLPDKSLRVFMAKEPIDIRKGIDSLASIVQASFHYDPCDHALYLFTNRRCNRLKGLYFDGTGFWLFFKRVEEGRFKWRLSSSSPCPQLSHEQLIRLLDGLEPDPKGFRTVHYDFV